MHVKQGNSSNSICFSKCFVQSLEMCFNQTVGRIKKQKKRGKANIHTLYHWSTVQNDNKFLEDPLFFQNSQNVVTKETG